MASNYIKEASSNKALKTYQQYRLIVYVGCRLYLYNFYIIINSEFLETGSV